AGAAAANTNIPVIGVPIDSPPLNGMDALLATVQMPQGIPVATVAIGKGGAYNAGVLAVRILALFMPVLAEELAVFKKKMATDVREKKNTKLQDYLHNRNQEA
ncbi:MAG TPA: AIR carboxylase family protein, partial [Candidatus Bathyarchaeia archaeon]|nr:AIR carboxylase family protein [Candidatus Bathyarchaeia archaeon]